MIENIVENKLTFKENNTLEYVSGDIGWQWLTEGGIQREEKYYLYHSVSTTIIINAYMYGEMALWGYWNLSSQQHIPFMPES